MRHLSVTMMALVMLAAPVAEAASLDEKLQAQWQRYDAARILLLERSNDDAATPAERLIDRDTWEQTLTPSPEMQLSERDLVVLRLRQRQRIERARYLAAQKSIINLDDLRKVTDPLARDQRIARFCGDLPKGGMLHIHPSGTLSRDTVAHLLTSRNPVLPFKSILESVHGGKKGDLLYSHEIQWIESMGPDQPYLDLSPANQRVYQEFLFLPPGKQPFTRFNGVFAFIGPTIPTDAAYEEALLDFAHRAVAQRVSYVEFTTRSNPGLFEILARVERATGLVIRVNHSFQRTLDPETLLTQGQDLLAQPANPWVVGIDFLDDELTSPALEHGQLLYGAVLNANVKGMSTLRRTMHAGEIGDVRNPRDAIILGAERLGHGVKLHSDLVAMEYAVQQGIPVEVNISSNLRLTEVNRVTEHPFLDYLRVGLPVSLSTDDEGIFETNINRECRLAIGKTDVTYHEMKQMAFNAITTSFAHDIDKQRLKQRLRQAFEEFEKKYTAGPDSDNVGGVVQRSGTGG